jgi:hypothetical protein
VKSGKGSVGCSQGLRAVALRVIESSDGFSPSCAFVNRDRQSLGTASAVSAPCGTY